MSDSPLLDRFDPFDPVVVEEPRPFFAALRKKAPVYRLPGGAYTLISRYDDVRAAALAPETFSSKLVAVLMQGREGAAAPEVFDLATGGAKAVDVLAIADAPQHTRQRKLSNRAFSMRRVAAMEPRLRALAAERMEVLLRAGGGDWVAEMAVPLPVRVIADLVGVPREDTPQLKRWSDASVALLSGVNTPEQLASHAAEVSALIQYLAELFDRASATPGDDVLGDLVRATRDPEESLSRDEVVSILVQLLTAGNETTTSLIGSALLLLLRNPELERQLRADARWTEPFIEEAVRLESPFYGHFRVVNRTTQVAGVPLRRGERVMLLWASANRDAAQFANPDRVDLGRRNLRAHLSFGIGMHHCIGAALARLETRVVLETLLDRTRVLRSVPGSEARHVPSLFVRSLTALPIELAAA